MASMLTNPLTCGELGDLSSTLGTLSQVTSKSKQIETSQTIPPSGLCHMEHGSMLDIVSQVMDTR